MTKVNLILIIGIGLVPMVSCATYSYDKHYKSNNYRRVGLNNNDKEPMAHYPVYNHQNNANNSVQDMTAPNEQLTTGYTYQQPPVTMDNSDKSNNGYLPPSTSYGVPDAKYSSYGSPNNYGPPTGTYDNPIKYEPPSSSYGNPPTGPSSYGSSPTYGPPIPSYPSGPYYPSAGPMSGPMQPLPQYGPPTMSTMMVTDQKGHEGLMEKFIKKIDLVLLSKMLLKLVIFKKIIKFIAIICLLMFIPVLKKKFEESAAYSTNEDEERHSRNPKLLDSYANVDFRVKEIASFALTAIEAFETHDIRWCVGESEFYCRVQYMLDAIDLRYPGNKMLGVWFPALVTTIAPPTESTTTAEEKKMQFNDFITESTASSIEHVNDHENFVKK